MTNTKRDAESAAVVRIHSGSVKCLINLEPNEIVCNVGRRTQFFIFPDLTEIKWQNNVRLSRIIIFLEL